MMMGAEIKIIKSGWPVVSGAFDLWSYAMFPGESAHRRDLGESPVSQTVEDAAIQSQVAGTRPRWAWRTQALPSWTASPDGSHWQCFSQSLDFCPAVLLSSVPLRSPLWLCRWPAAWPCVRPPCRLRDPP